MWAETLDVSIAAYLAFMMDAGPGPMKRSLMHFRKRQEDCVELTEIATQMHSKISNMPNFRDTLAMVQMVTGLATDDANVMADLLCEVASEWCRSGTFARFSLVSHCNSAELYIRIFLT